MNPSSTELLLERFHANTDASRDLLALAEAEPVVSGHAGQPKAHPAYAMSVKCAEVALRLHTELRLAGALKGRSGDALDELEPIGLHEARHTYASFMIAAGVTAGTNPVAVAKQLSEFMGHASITVTLDRYGHLFPGAEGEAARALDAYLDRTISV